MRCVAEWYLKKELHINITTDSYRLANFKTINNKFSFR